MYAGVLASRAGRTSWTSRRCVFDGLVTTPSQPPKPRSRLVAIKSYLYQRTTHLQRGHGSYVHEAKNGQYQARSKIYSGASSWTTYMHRMRAKLEVIFDDHSY